MLCIFFSFNHPFGRGSDASDNHLESFLACSKVAKTVNQKVYESGGILIQYNKFITTFCEVKDAQLSFNYQIETL